ncbi:MAG: sugar ABC transporter ATP-binding protein [Solirubrobacteraceae bacterium]
MTTSPDQGVGAPSEIRRPDAPVLLVRRLSKTFVGERALEEVSFDVRRAEVHALVGHNGSGKSTLIKILAGYHQPDDPRGASTVEVAGEALRPGDPGASHAAGLRFIHQELGLVERLTVLENLRLGATWMTGRGGHIRWGPERQAARALLERVGLDVHPEALVSDLGAVQRTQVAVARALQDEDRVRVLFFDEPTATLPGSEVDRLFAVISSTVARGIGVVYVSHRLEELPRIADRVTVLRDGRVVGSGAQTDFARERLVELIVGGDRPRHSAPRSKSDAAPDGAAEERGRLSLDGVHGGELRGASLAVHGEEIVGVAGLVGSGVHDVIGLLLGRVALSAGSVSVAGRDLERLDPHEMLRRRVAVLPSSRTLKSVPSLSVRENLTLSSLAPLWRHGRLQLRREREVAAEQLERFNVLPRDPERPIAQLSGGNQQKVTVAKWLRTDPRVMVLEEPTQGIDVGGKQEILDLLRESARRGLAILVCSSDLEELELVCDRVLVIRRGCIGAELTGSAITRERIAEECYMEQVAHA